MGGCGNFDGSCPNPTVVNLRDRVTAEEIQTVLFNDGLTTVALRRAPNTDENPGWATLFDCTKDTCISTPGAGGFLAGEALLFIFEEPVQLESAEIVRKAETDDVGNFVAPQVALDVIGTWIAVHPDGTTTVSAAPEARFIVNQKVSALYFEFEEDTSEICEAVFKKFIHVETTAAEASVQTVQPEPAASYEDSTTAGVEDAVVSFPAETVGVQLANDSMSQSVLFTFRQTDEAAAPATGTALRTLTLLAGEKKSMDNFRVLGLKHKSAGLVDAAIRISAW